MWRLNPRIYMKLMEDVHIFRQARTEEQMQTLVLRLKVCPVCNSLTRTEAEQCGICNWSGKFETDPVEIADHLANLLAKCPELLHTLVPAAPPSFISRMKEFLNQEIRLRKRLDLSA